MAKGPVTQFVDMIQLEDNVHVTQSEAEAACEVILKVIRSDKGKCASIAVDNVGKTVADAVVSLLRERLVLYGIIVTRDPAHSLDLGPKDLFCEKDFVKPVVTNTIALL